MLIEEVPPTLICEGVGVSEHAGAANAVPKRARTTNTENIDEPFFIYTTLSYFALYRYIILEPFAREWEAVAAPVKAALRKKPGIREKEGKNWKMKK